MAESVPLATDLLTVRNLKRFVGLAVCQGYKCRLPHCESCYGDEAEDVEPALQAFDAALSRIAKAL